MGSYSALINNVFPGIVSQAAIGTIFALFAMFFLYTSKIIKCTNKFRMTIFISILSIFGIYILQFILLYFNLSTPSLFSNSPVGIAFSVFVVAIASFKLIVDFDSIKQYTGKVEKYFEWYGGFSLMVTIVWLYIEILNLLVKIQSRNN